MDYLELLDWRRTVSELFSELRRRSPDAETLSWFRAAKDRLFREHPQSPIPPSGRDSFRGLQYWPHDPSSRVTAQLECNTGDDRASAMAIDANEARLLPVGDLHFELNGLPLSLRAYWVDAYGGGLFVPFRDGTSGTETYGAGRYLLDSIKGADLGSDYGRGAVVLDFNYAYHPSCTYDPQYLCPLAPPENWLTVPVRAGERLPSSTP